MERENLIQEIVLEAHKQGIVTNAELATFRDGVTVGIEAGAASVDRVEIVREAFEELRRHEKFQRGYAGIAMDAVIAAMEKGK